MAAGALEKIKPGRKSASEKLELMNTGKLPGSAYRGRALISC
eukprot:SAG31_NODE_28704_length_406_cov_0.833876_1_plen_41_part_10